MPDRNPHATARILVADDTEANVRLLERVLHEAGYTDICGVTDAAHVLERFEDFQPDVVLLDLHMPGADGHELLHGMRRKAGGNPVPVIVVTRESSSRSRKHAVPAGATECISKPYAAKELLQRIRNLLETRALERALDHRTATLERRFRQRTSKLVADEIDLLQRVAGAAEARDGQEIEHTRRVGELAAKLARAVGVPADQVELIRLTAPLHDIGKIAIPDGILMKPGRYTPEEFAVMKTHTTRGAEILAGSNSELLVVAEEIARSHHEWWNGTGYPARLAGEKIPLPARIVAVADVYDALTNPRSYRPAVPFDEVVHSMLEESGTHYDPAVVSVLPKCVRTS